jgi:dipeptidase E
MGMMRKWRLLGIDKLLIKAYESGTVMSGLSAGAICWFKHGHSDSMSYYPSENWEYIRMRGLGLINAFFCPHYNTETRGIKREKNFKKMFSKFGGNGLAVDDNAAIVFINGRMRPLSVGKARAYRLTRKTGKVSSVMIHDK